MRSLRLLVVAVLAVLVAASSFSPVAAFEGEIKITKLTTNGDTTTVFHFTVSDEVELDFDLFGGGDKSFNYGGGRYVVIEEVPPGWVLDVNCVSLDGASTSFEYMPGQGVTITYTVGNFVVCTFTNSPTGPVGGVVTPVNNFALLTPWLAVIGLVGCISTVVVVAKKRQS
jgi:hypothetical protein